MQWDRHGNAIHDGRLTVVVMQRSGTSNGESNNGNRMHEKTYSKRIKVEA
jgi:hypothetical protein